MTPALVVIGCLGLALIAAALLDELTARRRRVPGVITDLERRVRRR